MTEQEMIQKIYEVIKLVDCMQYNPSVDFNYLRAKGAYNVIKNQVEHIEAENAELRATLSKMETVEKELRARLEKAVELPCKLGDTIYKVYDRCDGHNCPYNGHYGQWRCHYEGERRCEPFIKIRQFCYGDIPLVNDTVFVSREAAEARLKEIKEKKDDERPKKDD